MDEQKKPSRLDRYLQSAQERTDANEVGDWISSKGGRRTIQVVLAVLIISFLVTAIAGML